VSRVRIAVAGAGLIGRRHIEEVDASAAADLAAIVDPFPSELAVRFGVTRYDSLADLFAADRPDGVVLATPNRLHVEGGLECIAAGVPVIVEKPVGDTVEGATRLVEAGEAAGIAVLTGHHRNHSPIMVKAREVVRSGALGTIVAVTGTAMFHKPDGYFEVGGGWRKQPGGGPILLNLIHEVNNLLALVGDVVAVQAGLLPHRRHGRLALGADDAAAHLPGRALLVRAVRDHHGGAGAQRPPSQPDHPLRRGDPRRSAPDLHRTRRPEDAESDSGGSGISPHERPYHPHPLKCGQGAVRTARAASAQR
jgi:predicted dehydrogenase